MAKKTADLEEQGAPSAKAEKRDLRAEIDQLKKTVRQAVIVAAVAIVAAVSTPVWAPMVSNALNESDPASTRALVLAVEQLRPAISSSRPFEQQITLVRRMMADDREVIRLLETIEGAAPYGIPSSRRLRDDFVAVANQIFAAELFRIQPDERWISRAMVRMASAVRPHDLAQALELNSVGPASAVLAEAAHHLSNDDVGSAISSMNRLEGSYAALAAPWLAKAQVRYDAGRALERLDALVAARLPGAFAPGRGSSDAVPKMLNNHSHN